MVPAVAGDLMAGLGDAADQRGMALGDPAQGEEGRLHPGLVEQAEHRVGIALDAALQRLPIGRGRSRSRRRRPGTSPRRRPRGRSASGPLQLSGVGAVGFVLAVSFDPIDEHGQDAAEHRLLLDDLRLQGGDALVELRIADRRRRGLRRAGAGAERAARSGSTFSSAARCGAAASAPMSAATAWTASAVIMSAPSTAALSSRRWASWLTRRGMPPL